MSIKRRVLAFVLLGTLIPTVALANSPTGQLAAKMVDLGGKKVNMMETMDKGAMVSALPQGVGDVALFEALDRRFSQDLEAQMKSMADAAKAKAEEANAKAREAAGANSDIRIQEVTYRSGSNTGTNSSARSSSFHSGYRNRGWTVVTINAAGNSSGSWTGSATPQHIILNEQLCFSGAAVTVSWPPSLSGSSSCGSYQSSPWSGTKYVNQRYSNASARSYIGLFSTTQSDSATVRINNTDYRPSSQVTLSFGL